MSTITRSLGDKITLPAGLNVGMGKLRHAVAATIDHIDLSEGGEFVYGVRWTDSKTGRSRHAWVGESEIR